MHRVLYLILLYLGTVLAPAPVRAQAGAPEAPPPSRSILLLDRGYTAYAGSFTLIGLHDGVDRLVTRSLGGSWWDETHPAPKAAGIFMRIARTVVIDQPLAHMTMLVSHEVYGHGGRMREVGYDPTYYLHWPPPYGDGGGGATRGSLLLPGRVVSPDEERIISGVGGFETMDLMQRHYRGRWMLRGRTSAGDALVYLIGDAVARDYVDETVEPLSANEPGHDIAFYLTSLNERNGVDPASEEAFGARELKRSWRLNRLDTGTLTALYTLYVTYLFHGEAEGRSLGIPVAGARWLPSLRTTLSPFGPQQHLENVLASGGRTYLVDLRRGDPRLPEHWWGSTVSVQGMALGAGRLLDIILDLWSQPTLETGGETLHTIEEGFGWACSVRTTWTSTRNPFLLVLEAGWKSPGWLVGRPLEGGLHLLGGIGIDW